MYLPIENWLKNPSLWLRRTNFASRGESITKAFLHFPHYQNSEKSKIKKCSFEESSVFVGLLIETMMKKLKLVLKVKCLHEYGDNLWKQNDFFFFFQIFNTLMELSKSRIFNRTNLYNCCTFNWYGEEQDCRYGEDESKTQAKALIIAFIGVFGLSGFDGNLKLNDFSICSPTTIFKMFDWDLEG